MSAKRSHCLAYEALGVQALSTRLAALLAEGPGLARLRLRLEQVRERRQRRVVSALTRFETRTAPELAAFLARRHGFGPAPAPTADACAAAREALAPLLAGLLAHAPHLPEPAAAAEHHALRIAAKRLRYALEIFEPLDPELLGAALRATRRLQSKLGDLHDCDVWIAFVPGFLEEERRRTLEYFGEPAPFAALRPGLLALAEGQAGRRPVLHAECVALWNELAAQGVWDGLTGAPADPAPAPLRD